MPKTVKKLKSEVFTPVKTLVKQTSPNTPVKTAIQLNSATPLRVVVKEMSDTFLKDEMRQKSTTSKCYFMTMIQMESGEELVCIKTTCSVTNTYIFKFSLCIILVA